MKVSEIKKRIDKILSNQSKLESLVVDMQNSFLEAVLFQFKELATDPYTYDVFFVQFVRDYHLPIIQQLSKDLFDLINSNSDYFKKEALASQDSIWKISDLIRSDFGISSDGNVAAIGYLSDISKDTTVKRNFKSYLTKIYNAEYPINKTRSEITKFVKGTDESLGVWESFFNAAGNGNTSIFDLYQKADRYAQNEFAKELELDASLYVGGLISGSRQFCKDRNGKVFLREEIRDWSKLSFAGKPKNGYDPFTDLGGYRCRHHLSYISNATATRLDKSLILINNKLQRA